MQVVTSVLILWCDGKIEQKIIIILSVHIPTIETQIGGSVNFAPS